MADAPAGGAGGAKQDPEALIAKHAAVTQSGAAGDAAIVSRVEASIKNSPMGWLQGVLGETGSRAASEQGEVHGKLAEHQDLVAKSSKDAPKDAGPPPAPGPAAHPAVPHPAAANAKAGAVAPAPAAGGAAVAHAPIAGASVAKSAHASAPAAAPAPTIAGAVAGAGNDQQLDGILNAYTPKSAQTTQTLGRIKQMGDVAQGFNGQLDVYVSQGGAIDSTIAGSMNFLGAGKDANAIWRNNPYRKVHGVLGGIMTGMSAVKSVCSIVGSICGKLGMVLTVIGLLGMIFPPIGAAVSGIARILSVVGLICDAISFVLSGILTGLNGVVLAQQIAAGASAEEKAASADMMMSEANDAASGFVNLAMMFGPKFMKGMLGSSKGVVASLLKRAKATIGQISLKVSSNVSHFANKIVRKLGFGGAKMARVGGEWKNTGFVANMKEKWTGSKVGKAFYGAPQHIEAVQEKLMAKYGNTTWAKKLDRVGAWGGSVAERFDIEAKVGKMGESSGKWVGGLGADTKLGKSMAAAAERSEVQTRELAMKLESRDAAHLEETRWRNELNRRQAANPEHIRDAGVEDKFVGNQGDKVRAQAQADFTKQEQQREAKERLEQLRTDRFDRRNNEFYEDKVNPITGKGERDYQMDRVHNSRQRRYDLEATLKPQESERRDLLAKATKSAEDQSRLTALNSELKPLDEARRMNKMYETDLSGLASGSEHVRKPEYHNWKDVTSNAWEATSPVLEMLDLKDRDSAWSAAEKADLKKQVKYNKGSAQAVAASRGGHGTLEEIAHDTRTRQLDELTAFVRATPGSTTLSSRVGSMLSPITSRAPVAAPGPATATTPAPAPMSAPTAAPTGPTQAPPVHEGGVSVQPTGEHKGENGVGTSMAVAAQVHEPAATAPAAAPAAHEEPEPDGGGEALPYWPALLPEFDKAQHDFGWMRKVAVEFKKAQIEGKQKAVDTLAVYGRYKEYSALRSAAAKKNQEGAAATGQATAQNVGHATQTEGQAGQGEAKQGEAKGAANDKAATDLPEPESRGFWGRILGAVKRWAKNKAAQVFGWIQEKIASVIMKGLCGVSMGDMREYAGALRRQQQAAHGVADDAGKTSGAAATTSIKLGADATKEAQGAADAIGECDKNIIDADTFMSDVTSFEGQLAEEKANAQIFISQVQAAAHAEQARKQAEEAAHAAEEAKANERSAAIGGGAPAATPAAAPAPTPEDHGEAAQITAAAGYVASEAEIFASRLEARADDYTNQLALALTNKTGKSADGVDLKGPAKKESKHIVEEFKHEAAHTKIDMEAFHAMPIEPSQAKKIAEQIITSAQHLEASYTQSENTLDELFARTYNGIKDGRRTLKSRALDGDNVVGSVNRAGNEVDNTVIDHSLPVLNTAWNTVSKPIQTPEAAPASNAPAPTANQIAFDEARMDLKLPKGTKDVLDPYIPAPVVVADNAAGKSAATVQLKSDGPATASDPGAVASAGVAGASDRLPHHDQIQASFGKHDISHVRSATGGNAADASRGLGAQAYAVGDKVGFAKSPDLHTAAHEAAHVVQQQSGVQLKSIDQGASDPLEQHADSVADAVVAGKSAEPLLDKFSKGSAPKVQRKEGDPAPTPDQGKDKGKKEDLSLPDGVNMQIRSDGMIVARVEWLESDPGRKVVGDGTLYPARMVEMLQNLRSAGVLSWIEPAQINKLSHEVGITGGHEADAKFIKVGIAFNVYLLIGPPPNVDVMFSKNGKGLDTVIRQSIVVPGEVTAAAEVNLSAAVRAKVVTALEAYTGMPIPAGTRTTLLTGHFDWKTYVSPDYMGVSAPLTEKFLEQVYTKPKWTSYLEHPPKGSGSGAPSTGGVSFTEDIPEAERQYFLQWMKQLEGAPSGKAVPTNVTTDLIAKLHEIDASPLHDQIMAKLKGSGDKPGEKAEPKPFGMQLLENAINAAQSDKAYADLGMAKPTGTYKPLFDEPVQGSIVNRGALNYVGQDTQFFFRTENGRDAFAIPDLIVKWVITKKGATTHLDEDVTHSIDISTHTPDYYSYAWKETGIYTVHAFVSHSFYQSTHKQIDVEVKTEAQRTEEINTPAFKGLAGNNYYEDKDHPFDVSTFNTAFGSHKEEYGKATWGYLPDDFKRTDVEQRIDFLANDRKQLEDMIAAHKGSDDPRWKDAVSYAQHKLDQITESQATIGKEKTDGNTFFDARGTFLSRKNGVPDKALTLVASAKKEKDSTSLDITIHDFSQVYEPENYTFNASGNTFDAAIEKAFVTLCKSYPPGRISALFEALDDNAQPTKKSRGFEFDTGTAWKDVKSVAYNDKVQLAVNILGAVTMVFFPPSAAILFPVLATYNSIDVIDNMADLKAKGNLTWQEVAKGVGQIGLNFIPYLGELKPIAALGKTGMFMLDGVIIAGQAVIMTAQGVQELHKLRDADIGPIAELDAKIRAKEATNQSDPELPQMRADLEAMIKHAQAESESVMKDMAKNGAIMLVQMAALKGLQAHVAAKSLVELKNEGIFHHQDGVEPHYDSKTGTVRGDERKIDAGKLAELKQQYALDMAQKRTELQNVLGSEQVEITRGGTKTKVTKVGEGYKVEVPPDAPFSAALDEARRVAKQNGHTVPDPRGTPERALTNDQQALVTAKVPKQAGAKIGDTVDSSYLSDEQVDIARWQTHGLEDTAADTTPKNAVKADTVKQWLNDPEFRHWYDVWMSMPDRVTVDAAGHEKVNLPHGVPDTIAQRIEAVGAQGNVGMMTRALDISKRIEKEFPGLDCDPNSTAWKQARPKLVEMLGEDQVKKYEMESGKSESPEARQAMDHRLGEICNREDLEKIEALLPGTKIYVTGSAAQTTKSIETVTDIDVIVVVKKGTPQNVRVELEVRLQQMTVRRPGPEGKPMPIDAKVMTEEQFTGLSMCETPEGRTPMTNYRIDSAVDAAVPGTGPSGGDLHNHVMGIPETQYFIDKVGGGSAVATLEKLVKDVDAAHAANPAKRAVTPDVERQIRAGYAEVEQAKKVGMAPDVVESRARRVLDNVLSATEHTPFDATYDVRDLFVANHIDKGKTTFQNYAKDVITDLHDQGITYSEQSVSASKLDKRFTPEAMDEAHKQAQAEGKDSDMKFLVMAPTSETLSSAKPPTEASLKAGHDQMKKYLMRKDVNGMDIAGPEKTRFTEGGMDWLRSNYKLLDEVAKAKGERMVLRPHVGEGYDPGGTHEHVEIAQANLDMLVKTLHDLGYNGQGNVIVRLGHATHATPETLKTMASMGVIVEANVGSNLATGSVLRAEDHPLMQNMYYGVRTCLSTDGQGVMSTTLPAEYQRAGIMIDKFRGTNTIPGEAMVVEGKPVYYKDLPADVQKRFSVEWLEKQLADYRADAAKPVTATPPVATDPPPADPPK